MSRYKIQNIGENDGKYGIYFDGVLILQVEMNGLPEEERELKTARFRANRVVDALEEIYPDKI